MRFFCILAAIHLSLTPFVMFPSHPTKETRMGKEKCKGSGNCNKPVVKDGLCADHLRIKQQAAVKAAAQKAAQDKAAKEGEAKRLAGVALAAKNEKLKIDKAAKVKELATAWNGQVRAVVTAVQNLRKLHPDAKGINAGSNKDKNGKAITPDIPGGTSNPITFVLPSNTLGITKADVYAAMTGFEGSDSGSFKFRVSEVFVHGH
jgi:hypothetical protein